MAINLETLSPTELQSLIANAQTQMQAARANHVRDVRAKIDNLLKANRLALTDVYPVRGGKGAKGPKSPVAPKYRNPQNAEQTWSGRGKRPLWFVQALKKRGVTPENLLIDGAAQVAPPKAVKPKAAKPKAAKKGAARKSTKTSAKKVA